MPQVITSCNISGHRMAGGQTALDNLVQWWVDKQHWTILSSGGWTQSTGQSCPVVGGQTALDNIVQWWVDKQHWTILSSGGWTQSTGQYCPVVGGHTAVDNPVVGGQTALDNLVQEDSTPDNLYWPVCQSEKWEMSQLNTCAFRGYNTNTIYLPNLMCVACRYNELV